MATTAPTNNQPAAKEEPKARAEFIPCTVIKKFYSAENQLLDVGAPYNYFPKDDQPFPWNVLRPNDSSLEAELEKEYKDHKKTKQNDLRRNQDIRSALATIGASGE